MEKYMDRTGRARDVLLPSASNILKHLRPHTKLIFNTIYIHIHKITDIMQAALESINRLFCTRQTHLPSSRASCCLLALSASFL